MFTDWETLSDEKKLKYENLRDRQIELPVSKKHAIRILPEQLDAVLLSAVLTYNPFMTSRAFEIKRGILSKITVPVNVWFPKINCHFQEADAQTPFRISIRI
jgi:hypothetical protein